jgi:hypothetical protein
MERIPESGAAGTVKCIKQLSHIFKYRTVYGRYPYRTRTCPYLCSLRLSCPLKM